MLAPKEGVSYTKDGANTRDLESRAPEVHADISLQGPRTRILCSLKSLADVPPVQAVIVLPSLF